MDNKRGFTLIELLIVVVIIGILASLAIPKFASNREKAYLASMKGDLRNLAVAQEGYHADNFTYGATVAAVGAQESQGVSMTVTAATGTGWSATAAHSATSKTCAIFVGSAAPVAPATDDGVVACT